MTKVGPGRITVSGITAPYRCEFTLSHGVDPSSGLFEFPTQRERIPSIVDVTMECDGQGIRLAGCRLGRLRYDNSGQGQIVTAVFYDRRWKWAYAKPISGEYNIRTDAGDIQSGTEKTPKELAKLLLEKFGEERADISALPDDQRPTVSWDYASPARELQTLCNQLNCRVVLGADDRVRIVRLHQGRELPEGDLLIADSSAVDVVEPPNKLICVGAPIRYECRLELEAVAMQLDGSIVKADDAHYKPSGGWNKEYPGELPSLSITPTTRPDGSRVSAREVGLATLFRWYRIKDSEGGFQIPGFESGAETEGEQRAGVILQQILPIGSTLIETYTDTDGSKREKPAYVLGEWHYDGRVPHANTKKWTRIPETFAEGAEQISYSIDAARGIVMFSRPIYLIGEDHTYEFAKLWLHTTVTIRDKKTRGIKRYEVERALPSRRSRPETVLPILQDEVKLHYRAEYDDQGTLSETRDNKEDVDRVANYFLDATQREFEALPASDRPYAGIHRIEPDGAIQQVTWGISPEEGAYTRASRGMEHNLVVPSYKERNEAVNRGKVRELVALAEAEDRRRRKVTPL